MRVKETAQQIINAIKNGCDLYADIVFGRLPDENGISAYISEGRTDTVFLDRSRVERLVLPVLFKSNSQVQALAAASEVYEYINRCVFGSGIVSVNAEPPSYVDSDRLFYVYNVIINADYFVGGKEEE